MKTRKIVEYDCYFCDSCRDYIYDEWAGDPACGVEPHTDVESLSDLWRCPKCEATKADLRPCTLFDDFSNGESELAQAFNAKTFAAKA